MDKRYKKAFTLIELLVVISIIGIISSIAVVNLNSSRAKAKFASGQAQDGGINRALGDQIIGEWLFDEATGTTAGDASGNGRNGTIVGTTRVSGINNSNALSFGTAGYVSLGNDASLNPSNFTITAWIKPGDFSGAYNYIYSNSRDCCGPYNGINLSVSYNTLSGVVWNAAGGWPNGAQWLNSNAKISNDPVWTFIAFSFNGSKISLYINGHLDSTGTAALGLGQPASFNTYIGTLSNCPGGCGLNGAIDQVRLYGNSIVAANIERIYYAERGKYLAKK